MRLQHKFLVFEKKVVHCRKMRQLKNASALALARDIVQIILHLLHNNKDNKGKMENLVEAQEISIQSYAQCSCCNQNVQKLLYLRNKRWNLNSTYPKHFGVGTIFRFLLKKN